jgi:hypothetical protein
MLIPPLAIYIKKRGMGYQKKRRRTVEKKLYSSKREREREKE